MSSTNLRNNIWYWNLQFMDLDVSLGIKLALIVKLTIVESNKKLRSKAV